MLERAGRRLFAGENLARADGLRRDLDKLERDGRPLSRAGNLNAMYEMREKRYLRFADYIIDNNRALEDTVEDIRKVIL